MRRALLTARSAGPPFAVGSPSVFGTGPVSAGFALVNVLNPAPRAGTLTSVSAYGDSAGSGNIYLMTGVLSGATFTIAAATGPLAFASGQNVFPVSLAIPAGGLVGFYIATGDRRGRHTTSTGTNQYYEMTTTVPVAGNTYTAMAAAPNVLSIEGTGS